MFSDRLGSIGKYFPYGQERPSATQDGKEKFATYFRDSETGLDYADQRYHQPGMGRFMTPDPFSGSASANDPGSWNRYPYSNGDPVNNLDPSGLVVVCTASGNVCADIPTVQQTITVTASGGALPGGGQPQLPGGIGGGMCYLYPSVCGAPNVPTQAYLCMMPGASCQNAANMQSQAIEMLRQVWNDCKTKYVDAKRAQFEAPLAIFEAHKAEWIGAQATIGAIVLAVFPEALPAAELGPINRLLSAWIGAHEGAVAGAVSLDPFELILAGIAHIPVLDSWVQSQCGIQP